MRYHYLDNIPYSKMCELCELCELFVKKSHRFRDGIYLFLLSRIYSLAEEFCEDGSLAASSWAESCDFLSEPKRAARA